MVYRDAVIWVSYLLEFYDIVSGFLVIVPYRNPVNLGRFTIHISCIRKTNTVDKRTVLNKKCHRW